MQQHQNRLSGRYRLFSLALLALCTAPAKAEPVPEVARFGAGIEHTAEILAPLCTSQSVRAIDPPQIPGVSEQVQLDCEGFDYFGAKRKAEFIFGDDALTIVWILIEASEIEKLVDDFNQAYGEPSHDTANVTAYAEHNAAVRKDVPEALYYAPEVARAYQDWFDQQAGAE